VHCWNNYYYWDILHTFSTSGLLGQIACTQCKYIRHPHIATGVAHNVVWVSVCLSVCVLGTSPAHVAQWSKHSGAMCSRAWCAQWPGFEPQPRCVHRRIISNNSYARDEQGDNQGQEKAVSTVSSINCDRCRHLDLAASRLSAAPAWVELNRLGWPLAGTTYSTTQG